MSLAKTQIVVVAAEGYQNYLSSQGIPAATRDQVREVKKALQADPTAPVALGMGLGGTQQNASLQLRHTTLDDEEAALRWLGKLRADHPAAEAVRSIGGLLVQSRIIGTVRPIPPRESPLLTIEIV